MQYHQLERRSGVTKKARIGRGGKRGKTSGRGTKGQKARAGHKIRPELRDLIKKLPKLRGYAFKGFREKPVVVNVRDLEAFEPGATVSPQTLFEKGLIGKRGGKLPAVKILGDGALTKKVSVAGCDLSESARLKITEIGGSVPLKK